MSAWITVIGIGEDGLDGLNAAAREALAHAEVLAGGDRHLAFVPDFAGVRIDWGQGFFVGIDAIAQHVNRRVVVLASGDPLYFGVAKNLVERFGAGAVRVLPAPGAVSLACAALGWSQPDVQVVTIHGRPLDSLNLYLTPGQRLIVLTQDGDTPAQVAKRLTDLGFGPSSLTVLEHLGGPKEKHTMGIAEDWDHPRAADLNTLGVVVTAAPGAMARTRLAGLPDAAYQHDGQLTKRAVRAVTLSSLAPLPGETLWDFGAGAGSIAIEWMRAHESCRAIAVERDPVRAQRIEANAHSLGVPRLTVVHGESLATLAQLDGAPDAIFIGGGVSAPGLLDAAWQRLRPGARLVANAVTDASRLALENFYASHGGECFVIAVADKAPITHYVGYKPLETQS